MNVELKAIKFNHDPILTKTGAINLRRNATQTVTVPEWRPDICSNPECSPVAYTTLSMPAKMTIQALFSSTGRPNDVPWIRAVAEPDHILGSIEPVPIPLGNSGYLTLELPHEKVTNAPVGIQDIKWRWQFSTTPQVPETWTDFQRTKHRIYTILSKPTDPWEPCSNNPGNIHQPWTEVLEQACRWAAGAVGQQHDLATTYITRRLFDLGKAMLKYQGGQSYAFRYFECAKFLELLAGGVGNGARINCDDCATVVSTFANILGCDLSQSVMGPDFDTNRILLIGYTKFCATTFLHHSVAWKGVCTAADAVFDACLQLDNDGHPEAEPEDPLLPTNLLFGQPSDKTYQFCLVSSSSYCVPQPNDPQLGKKRRKLGAGYLGDIEITNEAILQAARRIYAFDIWPRREEVRAEATTTFKSIAFLLKEVSALDWQVHSFQHTQDERFTNVVELILTHSNIADGERLNINIYECSESSDWNDRLLKLLAMFEELKLSGLEKSRVGSLAFTDGPGSIVIFRRNQFLAVVRSAGQTNLNVLDVATLVDAFLLVANLQPQPHSQEQQTQTIKENKMAHRLSLLEHSFRVDPNATPVCAAEGTFDLTDMDDDGNIRSGTHTPQGGTAVAIASGRAFDFGDQTFLVMQLAGGRIRFEGVVTFEDANTIIVSGTKIVRTLADDGITILGQVEEPIVITKP